MSLRLCDISNALQSSLSDRWGCQPSVDLCFGPVPENPPAFQDDFKSFHCTVYVAEQGHHYRTSLIYLVPSIKISTQICLCPHGIPISNNMNAQNSLMLHYGKAPSQPLISRNEIPQKTINLPLQDGCRILGQSGEVRKPAGWCT